MKKLGILLLIGVSVFFGFKIVNTLTNEPATGVVVMEPVELTPSTTITGTTVMTEEEMDEAEMPAEEPIVVVDPMPMFEPLNFTGKKLKKFAKANGGKVMTVDNKLATTLVRGFGLDVKLLPRQIVKIGGDVYLVYDGKASVIHTGELIVL